MKKLIPVLLALTLLLALAACGEKKSSGPKGLGVTVDPDEPYTVSETAPGVYTAEIGIQNYGVIKLELDANTAPITVENFVRLAEEGFYDGLTFHRIMAGFMMQGGDPLGNGTGGSDQTIKGEFAANGYYNGISHRRGVISMARSDDVNSASSQFFICHADASASLDGKYAAFGHVTEGMEVVDAVCEDAVPIDSNGLIAKEAQPVIVWVHITGKPA